MHTIEWIVEGRVILHRGIGDQTVETIEDSVRRLNEYLDEGTAPVHMIVDQRFLGNFPADIKTIKRAVLSRHENIGIVIAVGGNVMFKFFSTVLTKITGGEPMAYSDTLEDALLRLTHFDPTLPPQIDYPDHSPTDLPAKHNQ